MFAFSGSRIHVAFVFFTACLSLAGCPDGDEPSQPTPSFTQSDLTGDWRYTHFYAGPGIATGETGWVRGISLFDGSGLETVLTYEDSDGNIIVPARPAVTYAISAEGVVTATTTAFTQAFGKMNPAKALFVTTATEGDRMRLSFYQRIVPGTIYSDADLASSTLAFHQYGNGAGASWLHGLVVAGADRVYSLTDLESSAGPVPDIPDQGTLSISASGVVTSDAAPTFAGFLSADKGLIVGTQVTLSNTHQLTVIFRSGGEFEQADLGGTWSYSNLAESADDASWMHGTVTFDASGVGTFGQQEDSSGSTSVPDPLTLAVAGDGTVTQTAPAPNAFQGVLSPAKDVMVGTTTEPAGVYWMNVMIR